MRRLFVAATLCAAVFALVVGSAAARHAARAVAHHARPDHARAAAGDGAHIKARFVPLGAPPRRHHYGEPAPSTTRITPSSAVSTMEWDALVSGNWTYGDRASRDGVGHYQMAANATTKGEIYAYPDTGDSTFGRGQRTVDVPVASDTVDLYPGRVAVEAYRGRPRGL